MSYCIPSLKSHHVVLIIGIGSETTVKRLRGAAVAVQEFTTTPIYVAKTILDIPSMSSTVDWIGL